jgi:hypothetical protein
MKIAINGDIVDTEDIYKITKILSDTNGSIHHSFVIYLFNKKNITITIDTTCYNLGGFNSMIGDRRLSLEQGDDLSLEFLQQTPEYQESLGRITKFRDSLIDIWSQNQSQIPQFNLNE